MSYPYNPGSNPSERGDNPENTLYEAWKAAPDSQTRAQVESSLLPLLRTHASKICWVVLHSHQPHLIEEMATDVILEIDSFKELSLFSTWVHSRFYNRARVEFRKLLIRKETAFTATTRERAAPNGISVAESAIDAQRLLSCLNERDQEFVRLKVFEGYTDAEIAKALDISVVWVRKLWLKLRKQMRTLYDGKVS
jgi:RNA polymerase sigma factor (sigma-70 family)